MAAGKYLPWRFVMNEVTREKLSSDFKALIGDVEELLKTTAGQTGEKIAGLRQRVGTKIAAGRNILSEQQQAIRAKAQEAKVSAEACLREKPWMTLGFAAATGLVLGSLLRRHNHSP
jgi:ElaB/YqjD/DUF883 family membrane-anchored ribosome-binding protein